MKEEHGGIGSEWVMKTQTINKDVLLRITDG